MKEEIFDFDKHKGRRIKVLIDCPFGGSVKKGEIGVLKYDNVADFPSKSGYCCGGGDNFYKKFELLLEDAVKEPQFEVGKWYKYTGKHLSDGSYYAKYLKTDSDNKFHYSERVFNKVYDNITNWSASDSNPVLLTDLSEIQQYLPDGHSDLLKYLP